MKRILTSLISALLIAVGLGAGEATATTYAFRGEMVTYYFQSHTVGNTVSYADGRGQIRTLNAQFSPNLYLGGKQQYWFRIDVRTTDRIIPAKSLVQSRGDWTYCRISVGRNVESKNWGQTSAMCA